VPLEPQIRSALERFLGASKGPVSEADVAAGTGIGVEIVRSALYELMHEYECSLEVREDGALVFDFGDGLQRIGEPSASERLRVFGRWLWKVFSKGYRYSLAFVLVGYAVTFVVLLLAAAIAASAAAKDEGPAEGAFRLVGAIFRGIFEFTTHSALIYANIDGRGYRHRHFEPKNPILSKQKKEHEKAFIASVYDFVLGPDRVQIHDGAQEREVASFVRQNGGVLTVSDVQALSGMSRAEAEKFFARFVARFDGEANITEDGTLVGSFETLLQSSSAEQDEPVQFFWDEYEPPFELTGNTKGRNVAVALLAGFNLAGAGIVTSGAAAGLAGGIVTALGIIPLIIFTLFFALPLMRAPVVWRNNKHQHETNVRKRLYREIFSANEESLRFEDILERANKHRTTEESLALTNLRTLMQDTAHEVGGTYDLNEADELALDASVIRREAKARAEAEFQLEEQEVVFSTKD
jgi:hypothetical protein